MTCQFHRAVAPPHPREWRGRRGGPRGRNQMAGGDGRRLWARGRALQSAPLVAPAGEQMRALSLLGARCGEGTYLALRRQGLAEAALVQRALPAAERELSEALHAVDGYEVPLAEWRVCATAARTELARGRRV